MEKRAYLTKRMLARTAAKAGREAAERAMEVAGFRIVAKDGNLVRINADGQIEILKEIPTPVSRENVKTD